MIDKQYEKELKELILRTNLYANDNYRTLSREIKDESLKKIAELIAFSSQDTKEVIYNLLKNLIDLQKKVIDVSIAAKWFSKEEKYEKQEIY